MVWKMLEARQMIMTWKMLEARLKIWTRSTSSSESCRDSAKEQVKPDTGNRYNSIWMSVTGLMLAKLQECESNLDYT